jgi:hypothetical protein
MLLKSTLLGKGIKKGKDQLPSNFPLNLRPGSPNVLSQMMNEWLKNGTEPAISTEAPAAIVPLSFMKLGN